MQPTANGPRSSEFTSSAYEKRRRHRFCRSCHLASAPADVFAHCMRHCNPLANPAVRLVPATTVLLVFAKVGMRPQPGVVDRRFDFRLSSTRFVDDSLKGRLLANLAVLAISGSSSSYQVANNPLLCRCSRRDKARADWPSWLFAFSRTFTRSLSSSVGTCAVIGHTLLLETDMEEDGLQEDGAFQGPQRENAPLGQASGTGPVMAGWAPGKCGDESQLTASLCRVARDPGALRRHTRQGARPA